MRTDTHEPENAAAVDPAFLAELSEADPQKPTTPESCDTGAEGNVVALAGEQPTRAVCPKSGLGFKRSQKCEWRPRGPDEIAIQILPGDQTGTTRRAAKHSHNIRKGGPER